MPKIRSETPTKTRDISGFKSTNSRIGWRIKNPYEISDNTKVSKVILTAVLALLPSCARLNSSASNIKTKTAKIETLANAGKLITGAKNKIPNTPTTTAQRINDILGKYCSFILNLLRTIRTIVDTATIIRNSPIPTTGPVATNTTESAAGRKIPKPLIPTTLREKAIIKVTIGKSSSNTMVLAGTPVPTAPRMAYLMGLNGQILPNTWFSSISSSGPRDSVLFWVISTGTSTGVEVGEAEIVAVADSEATGSGVIVFATTDTGLSKLKPKTMTNNKENNFRMGK